MTIKHFRLGWLVAVVMLTALACTCGPLSQVSQGVQTAQVLATQAQGLATQAQGLATAAVDAATQVEQAGQTETAQAGAAPTDSGGSQAPTAAVGANGLPDDIPVYSDNQGLGTAAGSAGYQSGADLKTLVDFYQTEMINKGWTKLGDAIVTDTAAQLSFQKGSRQAMINLASQSGHTAVGIIYTP